MSKRVYSDEMLNDFQQGSDAMSSGRLNHPDDIKKYFSSKNFKDFLADKTSPLVYCTLTLDGKPFLDKSGFSLHLGQKTNDHDSFTITVPDDALDSFQGYVMENSKNILGKNMTINLHRFGEIKNVFTGIIANVRNKKENGYGKLFITGSAPSILLENGKDCQSFEDKSLEQIIKEATSEYPEIAKVLVENPNTKYGLPYTVQYKESDYGFIKRLAARYGEYFYYNGQQMVFGNKVQPIITLEENIDLIDVELEMNIRPQEFNYHTYDVQGGSKTDKSGSSSQVQYKENPFQAIAINASKNVYKKNPDMLFNHTGISDSTDKELKEAARREKENRENLVQVKGKSKDPELKIGGRAKLIDINGKAMETYRITAITHYHDGNTYYNEFTGIPDLFNAPYQDNEALPMGEEQPARVVDNNDPMGMGRVRVQFPWQEDKGQKTPWIRLIQPHSGAGKGFHFIPEIGEEVLVGHESQNAEKPFVMGTQYNGSETSSYHTNGNDIKAFKTRSGIENISNDAEGSWKQSTPDGNFLHFDGQGNAVLNVPQKLTINATNVEINAFNNVEANVSNSMILNIMSKFFIFTPFMEQVVSGFMNLFSAKTLISSKETIDIEADEVTTHGTEKMFVHSDKLTTINSMEVAEMHGATKNNFTNTPKKKKKNVVKKITNTLVEFRPLSTWKGEVGYDWLRIDDGIVGQEKPYYDCLENGYEEPTRRDKNTEYESKDEAFKALEIKYLRIPISRISNPNLKKYYIPWLNLYPETVTLASTTTPAPPCEMDLQVLADVEIEEPDQIRIDFSKDYFTIDGLDGTDANPVLITDKAIAAKHYTGQTIKIKCIKEFSGRQEINVYAYPKDSLLKSPAEQLTLRKIAGRIVLEPNKNTPKAGKKPAVKNRKELKVVLVAVKTNIFNVLGNDVTGEFNTIAPNETAIFQNSLYQALIEAKLIQQLPNATGALTNIELDISSVSAFQLHRDSLGNPIDSTYIDSAGNIKPINALLVELKRRFHLQTSNNHINDFIIFSFNETCPDISTTNIVINGFAQHRKGINNTTIFEKSAALFNTRRDTTLPHECMHGLGLFHTHADGTIYDTDQKFVFAHARVDASRATDNIMSYQQDRKSTLHWQWEILKRKVK